MSHLTCRRRARSGGDQAPLPPCSPARRASQQLRQHQRVSRRRRSRRGRRTRPEIRRSLPGSLRAYLAFMTSPPGVLLRANGAPVLMRLTQSALSRGGAPGAVRGWRPPGRGALLVLVVVVKTRGGGACAGKDPDAAPPRLQRRSQAAAAAAPGTCSLRGAGGNVQKRNLCLKLHPSDSRRGRTQSRDWAVQWSEPGQGPGAAAGREPSAAPAAGPGRAPGAALPCGDLSLPEKH